jgi:K+-sensing histidine kinase KdpD
MGINAEFLPHIFDYFRRANGAGTGRHDGLGLGLTIVREIVNCTAARSKLAVTAKAAAPRSACCYRCRKITPNPLTCTVPRSPLS